MILKLFILPILFLLFALVVIALILLSLFSRTVRRFFSSFTQTGSARHDSQPRQRAEGPTISQTNGTARKATEEKDGEYVEFEELP